MIWIITAAAGYIWFFLTVMLLIVEPDVGLTLSFSGGLTFLVGSAALGYGVAKTIRNR